MCSQILTNHKFINWLVAISFPLLGFSVVGCAHEGASRTSDGLTFTVEDGGQRLEVREDPSKTGIVGFPNPSVWLQNKGKRLDLSGEPTLFSWADKVATWGFENVTYLEPGMSVSFDISAPSGASLLIDAPYNYDSKLAHDAASSGIHLWTGKLSIPVN